MGFPQFRNRPPPVIPAVAGSNQTLTPAPVVSTWVVAVAVLAGGAASFLPSPVIASWVVPAPTLVGGVPLVGNVVYHVWLELSAGVFTDVTADVITSGRSISGKRGNGRGGPTDLMADIGTLEFWLRNDDENSAHTRGYYSPYHASVRTGFKRGIGVKVIAVTLDHASHSVWRGKIRKILPTSGRNNDQQTYCYASDAQEDFADTNVKSLAPQVGQNEVTLIQQVIAAMPVDARPSSTSYDTPVDVYDYAFYDFGGGTPSVLTLLNTLIQNNRGRLFVAADGALTYANRHTLSRRSSALTLDNTFQNIEIADGLDNAFNRVQIVQHPKRPTALGLSTAPVSVLFSDSSPIAIQPGQTVTLWADYRDPNNTQKLLGAASTVTPLVPTLDYIANTAADGTGATPSPTSIDTTGTTGFSFSVKFVFTNTVSSVLYIVYRQIRGQAIYDDAPITVESYTPMDYGDRLLSLDLKYLSNTEVAQDLAKFIDATYNDPSNQAREIYIVPNSSAVHLTQSLTREIGDIVTASEAQTGLSSAKLMIIGMRFDITSDVVRHWWVTAPAYFQPVGLWVFDSSRFDVDMKFGYA